MSRKSFSMPQRNRMAEKEGFEPSMGDKAHTPLAGERLRPLGHLSAKSAYVSKLT